MVNKYCSRYGVQERQATDIASNDNFDTNEPELCALLRQAMKLLLRITEIPISPLLLSICDLSNKEHT